MPVKLAALSDAQLRRLHLFGPMIPVTVEKVFVFSLCLDRPFIQLTVTGQLGEKRNDRNLKGARHVVSWENFNAVIEGTAVI